VSVSKLKKNIVLLLALFYFCFLAFAQDEDFHHPELEWQTIETEHFYVHFHNGTERTAKEVAGIAESIYKPVTEMYNHKPDGRVHIVIRDYDDYSNGGAYFYDNKIEIRCPALDYELRGIHPWLWNVVTHEFTHIVQIQTTMKFGRKVPAIYLQWLNYEAERRPDVLYGYPNVILSYPYSGFVLPAWFAEGTAQYNNPALNYDYWDTHRDMILRMYVLSDSMLSWEEMSVFGKNSLGNESVYNAGFSMVEYIARNYGVDRLKDISAKLSKTFCLTIDDAIKSSLGITGEQLYYKWKEEKLDKYSTVRDSLKGCLTKEEFIEGEGFGNFYPAFSPDGKKLVYISNKNNDYLSQSSVFLYDLEKKDAKEIIAGVRSSLSFSPEGEFLYYSKITRYNPYFSAFSDLFRYNIKQRKEERLTQALRAMNPKISPDGSKLVFTYGTDGTLNIGVLDINKKNVIKLTRFSNGEQVYTPVWSVDGRKIAFGFSKGHNQSICIMNSDGTELRILPLEGDSRNPFFYSDSVLFFSWNRNGIFNIYCINLTTGELKQLTNVLGGAFLPAVNKENKLVYVSYTSTGYKIASTSVADNEKTIDTLELNIIKTQNFDDTVSSHILAVDKCLRSASDENASYSWQPENISGDTIYKEIIRDEHAKPYRHFFTSTSVYPFLRFDNYNVSGTALDNIKLGVYLNSTEILDKLAFFCGLALNKRLERDIFAIFDYKDKLPLIYKIGLDPSVSLELYNITRKHDAKFWLYIGNPTPDTMQARITYNLFEADFSITQRIYSDRARIKLLYAISRYTQDFGAWWHPRYGQIPATRSTYFIGNALSVQFKFNGILNSISKAINPVGRVLSFAYYYDIDKFNPRDSAKYESGLRVPVYSPYNFSRLEFSWIEHLNLPLKNQTFSIALNTAGILKKDSIDDFFNYYIGGFAGMRGYTYYAIGGNKTAYMNVTYRFPVSNELNFKLMHLYFKRLYASVFFDIGDGWYGNKMPAISSWKKDVGFEFRLEAFSYYLYPTRIFFSGSYGLDRFERRVQDVTLGFRNIKYGGEWHYYLGVLFDFELTDFYPHRFMR